MAYLKLALATDTVAEFTGDRIVDWDMTIAVDAPGAFEVAVAPTSSELDTILRRMGCTALFSETLDSWASPMPVWWGILEGISYDRETGIARLSITGCHALFSQPGWTTGGLRRGGSVFWGPAYKGPGILSSIAVAVAPDRSVWWQDPPTFEGVSYIYQAYDWFIGAWTDGSRTSLNSNWSVSGAGSIASRPKEYQGAIEFPFETTGDWIVVHNDGTEPGRVQMTVQTPPSATLGICLVIGFASSTDFYTAEFTSTQVLIRRRSGSSYTTLASASLSSAPAAGDVIAVSANGVPATLNAYLNGTRVASASDVTLNGYRPGIKVWSSSGTPTVYATSFAYTNGYALFTPEDTSALALYDLGGDPAFGLFAGDVLDAARTAAYIHWVPKQKDAIDVKAVPESALNALRVFVMNRQPGTIPSADHTLSLSEVASVDATGRLITKAAVRYGPGTSDYYELDPLSSYYGTRRAIDSASSLLQAQMRARRIMSDNIAENVPTTRVLVPSTSSIWTGDTAYLTADLNGYVTQHRKTAGSSVDEIVIGALPR